MMEVRTELQPMREKNGGGGELYVCNLSFRIYNI